MHRHVLLVAVVLATASCKTGQPDPPVTEVASAGDVATLRPDTALERLKAGNRRFVSRTLTSQDWKAQLEATAEGCHPFAAIVTTPDPRIPMPLAFDAGIGDLVSIRTPGPTANDSVIAALEQSVADTNVKVIVVLGHTDCKAVEAACKGEEIEHLASVLAAIKPAVAATPREAKERILPEIDYVDAVMIEHAVQTVGAIREASSRLRDLEASGDLTLVAAYYDVPTGAIVWL